MRLGFDRRVTQILGGGPGNPPPVSLENPKDRGAWRATIYRVPKSQTLKQLSTNAPDI